MKCHKKVVVTKLPWLFYVSRTKETLALEDLERNAVRVTFQSNIRTTNEVYMQVCNIIKIKTFEA